MIDTRAVAQEVQDQLLAAMQKGQEQVRKGQEQVREAVTGAIRTGNELAKSVRPSIPALQLPSLRIPALASVTDPAKLRAGAHEFAEQVMARQRALAGKAFEAATPLVADGVARLTKVAEMLQAARRPGRADTGASEVKAVDTAAADTSAADSAAGTSAADTALSVTPSRASKASAPKADGSAKPDGTVNGATPKARAAKANGTAPRARAAKPASPKE